MVYARRCESRRDGTRRYEERRLCEVVCGGGALDSLQSHSLSPFLRLDLFALPSLITCDFPLSLSFSRCFSRRGSRLKTRSKSRRRVASSRFGDSKEGSFLFPTLVASPHRGEPNRALSYYPPTTLFRVVSFFLLPSLALAEERRLSVPHRNQTRNARSDFENARSPFAKTETFWVASFRVALFQRPSLSRFFLSFLADLSGRSPATFSPVAHKGLLKAAAAATRLSRFSTPFPYRRPAPPHSFAFLSKGSCSTRLLATSWFRTLHSG